MAQIKTIKDLVYSQIQAKSGTTEAKSNQPKVAGRSAAAEFLGAKSDAFSRTPTSLKQHIAKQNSFVNPDKNFSTPTLLKRMSAPEATLSVAKAHSDLSKAEVKVDQMKDAIEMGFTQPGAIINTTRNNTFSRTPRTIENLIS